MFPNKLNQIRYKQPFDIGVELSEAEHLRRQSSRTSFMNEVTSSHQKLNEIRKNQTRSSFYRGKKGKAFLWAFNKDYEDLLGDAWFKAKYHNDLELHDVLSDMRRQDIQSRWDVSRKRVRQAQAKAEKIARSKKKTVNRGPMPKNLKKSKKDEVTKTVNQVNKNNYRSAKDRHDTAKTNQKKTPTEPPYERKDQKTKRANNIAKGKAAYKKNETVLERNQTPLEDGVKKTSSRLEKIKENAKTRVKSAKSTFTSGTSKLRNFEYSKNFNKLLDKKWVRRGIKTGLGVIAINFALATSAKMIGKLLPPEPAIPKYYDRGYDKIRETLTDFGSPVKLARTAQKTIAPYYSSVRKGMMTTVDSTIRKNIALTQSRNAIGHRSY